MRWGFFVLVASAAAAFSYWVYLRVELPVRSSRRLAFVRVVVLVTIILLLFDPRLPDDGGTVSARWVLLDASLSMTAASVGATSPWSVAQARARELSRDGWAVVTFGSDLQAPDTDAEAFPGETRTLLAPALERVAEAGGEEVLVLSDFRLEDPVTVRSALAELPLEVRFESFGGELVNSGISAFEVTDVAQPGGRARAEIELHGGVPGDSLTVEVLQEGRSVTTLMVPAPSPGLRTRVAVELPPSEAEGRVRYEARVAVNGDAFESDDMAPAYANLGHEEGGLVLVSVRPDWEPRFLLPILEDVTGLSAVGYVRAGPDRFVHMGRALSRGASSDSAAVRIAAMDAALLVVHGLDADLDPWTRALANRPGRRMLFIGDAAGAIEAGLRTGLSRPGEWYASSELPPSQIAGELSGLPLEGLPPLTDMLVPFQKEGLQAPFMVQFRGAGPREAPIYLDQRPDGRVALVLASGFWRWAARASGAGAYRRLWSGVAGWLLADQSVVAAAPRPSRWVTPRGEVVTWSVPSGHEGTRLLVRSADSAVVDLSLPESGTFPVGRLEPGVYGYATIDAEGDTTAVGRFDVAAATLEMASEPSAPEDPVRIAGISGRGGSVGRPVRTSPWPYLLIISLLCAEWIGRRRSGLR